MNFNNLNIETNKIEKVKTLETKIKEGVNFVFEQNPELAQIGTKEQYSEYLETIFPDSKIKDIVYHGTQANKFDQFNIDKLGQNSGNEGYYGKGFYFRNSYSFAGAHGKNIIAAIINLENPYEFDQKGVGESNNILWDYRRNIIESENNGVIVYHNKNKGNYISEYSVFNSENINILGSKKDIENFKEFMSQNK